MQFDVTVQRTEYREHVFRVDAEDRDAAFHAGLAAACDYDFHNSPVDSAGEDVTAIVPVTPNSGAHASARSEAE
jgi:hypothetical protein